MMNRLPMATFVAVILAGICFHSTLGAGGSGWGYEGPKGPSNWGNDYPLCSKTSQSPINIFEGDAVAKSISEEFNYKNYDTTEDLTMVLTNSGHGATVNLVSNNLPEITGGGLQGTYQAVQFHFHWSGDENQGSEHRISSRGFPSELHIVHYNTKYPDINTAMTQGDGLAVLGFMLEISAVDNANYEDLMSYVPEIVTPGAKVTLAKQTLNSFLPSSFKKFYRYSGSLTTPACYETVTWTVFKETIKISRSQLANFLELTDDQQMFILHNSRPVQPMNNRNLYASFDPNIHWGYYPGHYDPPHWPDYYESCGKESQSPVNIPSYAATKDDTLGSFTFSRFDTTDGFQMSIGNNGHTVTISLTGSPASVSGGSLPDTYNVAQFHFHWGKNSMRGSEHTVDAKSYPMEVHVVMYKNSIGSLGDSVKEAEGLAVLGFFFEISKNDNPSLDPIVNALLSVQTKNETAVDLSSITLDSFLPADRSKYYRYPGSLTTPGCFESVIWTVFESKIQVSEAQMNKFRVIKSSEIDPVTQVKLPMVDNYRPVQFLNSRIIRRNFDISPPPKQHWSYFGAKGYQNWASAFPNCASTERQSPIDIDPTQAEFMNIPTFEFKDFNTKNNVAQKVKNNGHSVTVSYESGDLQVSQGGLDDTYKVAQFHFHWGSLNKQGSEHTIGGTAYPMELHVVTYNMMYADIGLAMTQGNGLAVLGFMLQIADEDNPALEPLVSKLPDIQSPDDMVDMPTIALDSLLPKDRKEFFRYDGSLTTPTCDETVTWSVFYSTIPISQNQLNAFRRLDSSEIDDKNNTRPMVDNFRPVQPLGQRVVYSNFYISAAPSSSATAPVVTSIVFTLGKLAWSFN